MAGIEECGPVVIDAVAVDLDGTILEHGREIRPEVIGLLRDVAASGVRCLTATGRPIEFQLELLERHGIGARSPIFHALIADERELYLLGDASYRPCAAWNDRIHQRWQELVPEALSRLDDAGQEAMRRGWTSTRFPEAEILRRGLAALSFDDEAGAAAVCEWLTGRLAAAGSDLACNRNVRILQVYDSATGKGRVLHEMIGRWDIDAPNLLAIGDSWNDQDMLDGTWGFRAATVANANEALKTLVVQAGGYVAARPSGGGVVEAVRAIMGPAPMAGVEQRG